jgi:hypothetical protein
MVPRQAFNELKPNSGWNERNSLDFTEKKIIRETAVMRAGTVFENRLD